MAVLCFLKQNSFIFLNYQYFMFKPQCFTLEYLNFKFDFNLSNLKIKIFKGVTNLVNFMPHFSNVTQDSSICDNEGNLSEFDYPETPLSNMILTKNWLMKQIQSTYINIHLLNPILNNPNAFYVLD